MYSACLTKPIQKFTQWEIIAKAYILFGVKTKLEIKELLNP